jgi:hypothetical protein
MFAGVEIVGVMSRQLEIVSLKFCEPKCFLIKFLCHVGGESFSKLFFLSTASGFAKRISSSEGRRKIQQ